MAEETGYAALTVDQLGTELERRGLPKTGKKEDLITRLVDDDASQAGTEPKAAKAEAVDAEVAEEVAAAAEETEDDAQAAGDEKPADEEKPAQPRRRRGAAETTTRRDETSTASPAPRDEKGVIAVRAHARFVRTAPRKARLVMDHIRGKRVGDARSILSHTPRAAATDIAKLLESAIANAENNFELDPDHLTIHRAYVDEGPTIKRFRPRAQGRASPIHKRTSHMTITLTTRDEG
jgi:ribosomal protein L22